MVSDFVRFFEDEAKLKTTSEILSPLIFVSVKVRIFQKLCLFMSLLTKISTKLILQSHIGKSGHDG